jgi:hypothetical protein
MHTRGSSPFHGEYPHNGVKSQDLGFLRSFLFSYTGENLKISFLPSCLVLEPHCHIIIKNHTEWSC